MSKAKKLYRSTDDKMIGGVCGGVAEYFGIDPLLVRLIAVLLLIPGGAPGFLPYIILWIAVPERPVSTKKTVKSKTTKKS